MTPSPTGPNVDLVIVGGGLAGLPLAIACARVGLGVALVEREAPETIAAAAFDGRTTAVALGQQRVLAAIGVWPRLAPVATPILDIRVLERGVAPYLHYDHQAVGSEPLGWIVENRHFRAALEAEATALPSIIRLGGASFRHAEPGDQRITVILDDGRDFAARLLVGADGKDSAVRTDAGIGTVGRSYDQQSIIATIAHEKPHRGVAVENFLDGGPFAILPLAGNRSSIVWTERTLRVPDLLALDDDRFLAEVRARVGPFLGALSLVGARAVYPLRAFVATRLVGPRLALVGDAGHVIHPIAGQGINLGLRDMAALAELVVDAARLGLDLGAPSLLARYERWRRPDILAMTAATDGLNLLFSNRIAALSAGRRLGLGLVEQIPVLKRPLMRHAMGVLGRVPRMVRGEAL